METEPTYESIYEKIKEKRRLLGINEKDFTKTKQKTILKPFRETLISSSGGVMYK